MQFTLPSPIDNPTRPGASKVAKVYPTGRFSICAIPSLKRKKKTSVLTNDEKANLFGLQAEEGTLYAGRPVDGSTLLGLYCMARTPFPEARNGRKPFGSSDVAISNNRAARGSRGINWGQRDKLSWAIGYMERAKGKQRLSFLTLTIPSCAIAERHTLRAAWPEIVDRFIVYLKRKLAKGKVSTCVLGATEIQVERSKAEGWAVPHLHLVFQGRCHSKGRWVVTSNVVRSMWLAAIQELTGIVFQDTRAVENLVPVRVSAASYLSKYLSKCASKGSALEPWYDWHPADWVILGRRIRQAYNRLTLRSTTLVDSLLQKLLNQRDEFPSWLRPLIVQTPSGPMRLGWVGTAAWLATPDSEIERLCPCIIGS